MPDKESLDGQDYPVGVTFYANENADDLLSQLSAAEVETLDLRPLLSQTSEMVDRYFYKADNHWNSDGAFAGFQEILSCLHELFPKGNIDLTYAQADQWERHFIDDWSLGGWGKRVGLFFGGTDPAIWYTPKFATEMSCAIPVYGQFFRGDFIVANIRTQYLDEKNYFGGHDYIAYLGGAYGLVQHRNLCAPSPLKVMIIHDSFSLPLEVYLSTVFQEIDSIDLRASSLGCTFAEYVERTVPDIVIFALNSISYANKAYYQNFGVEEVISLIAEESAYELVAQQDIEVKASDDKNNYAAYPLEANSVYRISFEEVDILEGQTKGVELRLYDKRQRKCWKTRFLT